MVCELVVSDEVVARAGIDRGPFEWRRSELRGKREPLLVALVAKASALRAADAETAAGGAGPAAQRRPIDDRFICRARPSKDPGSHNGSG